MASSVLDPHDKMRGRDVNRVATGQQAPAPAHGDEGAEDAPPPPPPGRAVELHTAPNDARFPFTNQTRHCYARYLEYHWSRYKLSTSVWGCLVIHISRNRIGGYMLANPLFGCMYSELEEVAERRGRRDYEVVTTLCACHLATTWCSCCYPHPPEFCFVAQKKLEFNSSWDTGCGGSLGCREAGADAIQVTKQIDESKILYPLVQFLEMQPTKQSLRVRECIRAREGDTSECEKFARYYRSLCPTEWVVEWNRQREEGIFPGPL